LRLGYTSITSDTLSNSESSPVVLYDGVCGLCNHLVQFLLKRDTKDRFRFASLQSDFAQTLMTNHGVDPHDLDTVYVVRDHGQAHETLLARSDAILYMLQQLGGVWKLSAAGRVLPRVFRDLIYKMVARNRYRVFGKHESCMLPEPKHRNKFLDT
jgi:predicted DCC family thiol-disulfide oxidoreductase YuxK